MRTRTEKSRASEPDTKASEPETTEASPAVERSGAKPNGEAIPFFERLHQFNLNEWRSLRAYLYRLWPVIDRKESEHFISKLSEPFDEDYILRTFGSGKYHVRLNDSRGKTIASTTVNCHNHDFPPKVDPREVVGSDPQNAKYFEVWGQPAAPSPAAPSSDSAAATAITRLSEMLGKVIDKQQAGSAAEDVEADLGRISGLLRELKSLLPQQPVQADALSTLEKAASLVERLRPQAAGAADSLALVKEVLSVVEKLNRPGPASPLGQAKEFAETVKTFRGLFAAESREESAGPEERGGGAGEESALERMVGKLFDMFKPAMPAIGAAIAQKIVPGLTTPLQAGLGAVPIPIPPLAAQASPGLTQPPAPRSAQASESPASPGADAAAPAPENADAAQLTMLSNLATLAAGALNLGLTGDQFAEQIEYKYGGAAYDQITAIPKDELLVQLRAIPTVWNILAPFEASLPAFIAEFYAAGVEPSESDEGEANGADQAPDKRTKEMGATE